MNYNGLEIENNVKNTNYNQNIFFDLLVDEDKLIIPNEIKSLLDQSIVKEIYFDFGWQTIEILYLSILLDVPCSFKEIENYINLQNISYLNIVNNCNQFNYFKILDESVSFNRRNVIDFDIHNYHEDITKSYKFSYDKFLEDSEESEKIREANEYDTKNIFHFDAIQQVLNYDCELKVQNDTFLINIDQILYLKFYFENTTIDKLKDDSLVENIQFILKYIYKNSTEMNQFIEEYFINCENVKVFKNNWKIIKEAIDKSSYEQFNNYWKLLFMNVNNRDILQKFFNTYNRQSRIMVRTNQKDAAKHVLLILLNVPINEILRPCYQMELNMDEMSALLYRYKEWQQFFNRYKFLKETNKPIILNQFDLVMNKLIEKIEMVSIESEDEFSQLLEKNKFNQLEKEEKVEIISELVNVIHLKNTIGNVLIIVTLLFSLLPLRDIILDVLLAIKFYSSNEPTYCCLTLGILVITGIATIITEQVWNSEIKWNPEYLIPIMKYKKIMFILNFTQVTVFLRTLNETWLRYKIKKETKFTCLKYIKYGNPELLKKQTQSFKYVEMCFEAIPQTILQLYIIVTKNESDVLQIFSILIAICSITHTVWSYITTRHVNSNLYLVNHPKLIAREFCFYSLRIISTSLSLFLFSWPSLILWLICHILFKMFLLINISETIFEKSAKDKFKIIISILFKGIHSDLLFKNEKTFNIVSFAEFFTFCSIFFMYYESHQNNIYFLVLSCVVYPILLTIWFSILCLDRFQTKDLYSDIENIKYDEEIEILKGRLKKIL